MPILRKIRRTIRHLAQTTLCLMLPPLLAAQQATSTAGASPVTVPKDTKIELVSLENTSSEFAFLGAPVRFAVAKDVVVNGLIVLHAGAPVIGTITEFKRGIAHYQWASLTIDVREIQINRDAGLRLTTSNPETRGTPRDRLSDFAACALLLPACIILVIAAEGNCGEDGCPRKKNSDGQQALLPQCVSDEFWVRSDATVSSSDLDDERAASLTYPAIPCSRVVDRGAIFGQPGISFVEFK